MLIFCTFLFGRQKLMPLNLSYDGKNINRPSLGLHDEDPAPMDLELLRSNPELRVFDAIYRPTPLLKRAAELGLRAADGSEMLIFQGAASCEIWTGKPAPLAAMRRGFKEN